MREPDDAGDDHYRLDKWLWAARFFKSRSLAQAALAGGKVQIGGERVKPSRRVRLGDVVRIRKGEQTWEVVVVGLSNARRSAPEAALLYTETPESQAARQVQASQPHPLPAQRPDKRGRRLIRQFTNTP